MKLKMMIKISAVLAVVLFFIIVSDVSATVGGPIIIEKLSYKPSENSLYYLVHDQGGRGCPPIIEKIDLSTKKRTQVKTCNEIESTYHSDGSSGAKYNQLIEDTFQYPTVETLSIIGLTKNNISIAVEYVGEEKHDEYNISSKFRAAIHQGDQNKGMIDFIGCYKDQPNVFKGYLIPNTNKMALEISRIGDCFEGGYTKDDIYIIDDINFQDTAPLGYNYSSEPGVHRGNLVISAEDNITTTNSPAQNFASLLWIPTTILGLVIGFVVGHKTRAKSSQAFATKGQSQS